MPENFACPFCDAAIEPADTNIATDVAHCRACHETMPFSSVVGFDELLKIDLLQPPEYVSFATDEFGATTIVYRKRSLIVYVLIVAAILWTVLTIATIRNIVIGAVKADTVFYGLPFVLIMGALIAVTLFFWIGCWTIQLADGQGSVLMGVGRYGWKRTFVYNGTTSVSLQFCGVSVNDQPVKAITIVTDGQKRQFGALLQEESKQYIAALLRAAFLKIRT